MVANNDKALCHLLLLNVIFKWKITTTENWRERNSAPLSRLLLWFLLWFGCCCFLLRFLLSLFLFQFCCNRPILMLDGWWCWRCNTNLEHTNERDNDDDDAMHHLNKLPFQYETLHIIFRLRNNRTLSIDTHINYTHCIRCTQLACCVFCLRVIAHISESFWIQQFSSWNRCFVLRWEHSIRILMRMLLHMLFAFSLYGKKQTHFQFVCAVSRCHMRPFAESANNFSELRDKSDNNRIRSLCSRFDALCRLSSSFSS